MLEVIGRISEGRGTAYFFQATFPVIVGVNGIAVLFTPLFGGQAALRLFFTKTAHCSSLV